MNDLPRPHCGRPEREKRVLSASLWKVTLDDTPKTALERPWFPSHLILDTGISMVDSYILRLPTVFALDF